MNEKFFDSILLLVLYVWVMQLYAWCLNWKISIIVTVSLFEFKASGVCNY